MTQATQAHIILIILHQRIPSNITFMLCFLLHVHVPVGAKWCVFGCCRVKVGYHVVDPTVEAAEARLDAMKKGKLTRKSLSHKEPKHSNGRYFLNKNTVPFTKWMLCSVHLDT